jgi:Fe-S-cluster-containing dehydrogenase component
VAKCPTKALTVDEKTGAVLVDDGKCIACGLCITACPGNVPHLHPNRKHIVICDLCGGDPECAKICEKARFCALTKSTRTLSVDFDLYSKSPEEITPNLAVNLFGEKGEELV